MTRVQITGARERQFRALGALPRPRPYARVVEPLPERRFGCYWATGWVEEARGDKSLTLPTPTFMHLGSSAPEGFRWGLSPVPVNGCPHVLLITGDAPMALVEMSLVLPTFAG